ncbi:hypothetical protein ACS0TY_005395 [Phlomoides rotata]
MAGIIINPAAGLRFRPQVPLGRKRHGTTASLKCSLVEKAAATPFLQQEKALLNALIGIQGRGRSTSTSQLQEVERAVQTLEDLEGIPEPTGSSLIEGCWQLMFTTRPATASPIQRTFVGVDSFSVFQEVHLRTDHPRVSNIVNFSNGNVELKVEAVASIKDGKRILFQFDRAAFSFTFLPFKVPYPVPFRLLGDEAKGWLDTTYLSPSGNIRISRGNKAIDEFVEANQSKSKAELELVEGEWLTIWSSQEVTESWIENAAKGLMGKQIVRASGGIKFLVDILFGVKFSMTGKYVRSGFNSYEVRMDDAAIVAGSYGIPTEMETNFTLQLLYSDEKMRISRGYNKILFVHVRVDGGGP